MEQAGQSAYLEAIRLVTRDTLDREIQAMSGTSTAPQLLAILKEDTGFEPGWPSWLTTTKANW